jgi:hypothetical protein
MQEGIAPRREKVYVRVCWKEFFSFAGKKSSEIKRHERKAGRKK